MEHIFHDYYHLIGQVGKRIGNEILPLNSLLNWVNFQLSAKYNNSVQITNFNTDFKDCSVFIKLFGCFCSSPKILSLIDSHTDPLERSKQFLNKFHNLQLKISAPSPQDIVLGNEFEIVVFLCKIFLNQKSLKNKSINSDMTDQKNSENNHTLTITNLAHKKENRIQLVEEEKEGGEEEEKEQKEQKEQKEKEKDKNNNKEEESTDKKKKVKDYYNLQGMGTGNSEMSIFDILSKIGNKMFLNYETHQKKVLSSFSMIGKILPSSTKEFVNLKGKLLEFDNLPYSTNYSTKFSSLILCETFFKILKSFNVKNFKKNIENKLKNKFLKIPILNIKQMENWMSGLLNILQEEQIIDAHKADLEQSIVTLINQFFYSHRFKSRLTDELLQLFIKLKFISISVMSKDYDKLQNIIFHCIDKFLPGYIDIEMVKTGLFELFKHVNLNGQIENNVYLKMIQESSLEALGNTLYFVIDRLFGTKFGDLIQKFFQEGTKGKKRQKLYHNTILPKVRQIFEKSLSFEDSDNLIFSIQSSICKDKAKQYSPILFHLLDSVGLTLPFIHSSIIDEVNKNPTPGSLFRSNSVGQKVLGFFIRKLCSNYLKETLQSTILEMIEKDLEYEIDPNKIITKKYVNDGINSKINNLNIEEDANDLVQERNKIIESNLSNVLKYFRIILKNILNSLDKVPSEMRIICHYFKQVTEKKYPDNVEQIVGGFVFLRFFCPAIVSPFLRGIIDQKISNKLRRGLLLISSAIQNLSNGTIIKKPKNNIEKLNETILEYLPKRTKFLNQISDISKLNIQELLIPLSQHKEFQRNLKEQISPIFVNSIYTLEREKTITPKQFAINLLISTNNFSNWQPNFFNKQYSEMFFEKINQLSNDLNDFNKILTPIDSIVENLLLKSKK
ncbi:ras gtpase-activating protein [Anaeramoeba flamelloides]|uniref:Ras gtpase-activating protein n=1 Tax=Anaeramoeba flamelloides TaxID=1746091 RepID=A0AAV7YZ25_9EUKA|nr:ras gtpase-activating protein [Anaeramoeba flamelloides]